MHRAKGHKRLTNSDADDQDRIIAGLSHIVRLLGSMVVPDSDGRNKECARNAVAQIYSRYSNKANLKSLTSKKLFISANCVSLSEPNVGALLFRYSTVNVTFCNTNAEFDHAFVFVARDGPFSPLNAHVIHCDSPAQASEICFAMSRAFTVRSALYEAKRIEKAGWTTGQPFQQKPNQNTPQSVEAKPDERAVEIKEGAAAQDANNNIFGEFVAASQCNGHRDECQWKTPWIGQNGFCQSNGWSHEELRKASSSPLAEKNNRNGNGGEIPLAKVLLGLKINRGRSHSLPHGMENAQNGSMEDDDFDAFSMLARERSVSMSLVRPARSNSSIVDDA